MGVWKGIKKTAQQVVDLRVDQWADVQGLRMSARYFWQQGTRLFKIERAGTPETFEEATTRLSLSDQALNDQALRFQYLAVMFSVMGLLLITYALIISLYGNWMGGLISLSLSFYAFALGFRFHFWRFQILHKKLGCTFKEWRQSFLK